MQKQRTMNLQPYLALQNFIVNSSTLFSRPAATLLFWFTFIAQHTGSFQVQQAAAFQF